VATIRNIVTEAFRENNLIQVGDTPDGAEYVEAEKLLVKFIYSLFGYELGDRLQNFSEFDPTIKLPPNSRIIITSESPSYVELRDDPKDGERFSVIDPEGLLSLSNTFEVRVPSGTIQWENLAVLNLGYIDATWFYRAETGNWFPVNNLTSDDESPLPQEFDDLLSLWLAMRIAPRMGAQTKPETVQVYSRIKKMLTSRYKQVVKENSELGLYRTLSSDYQRYVIDWNG
jgi:hypothetical protein